MERYERYIDISTKALNLTIVFDEEPPTEAEDITVYALRGLPGKAGHTPVRGTDYWTAEDRQEIVNEVLNILKP